MTTTALPNQALLAAIHRFHRDPSDANGDAVLQALRDPHTHLYMLTEPPLPDAEEGTVKLSPWRLPDGTALKALLASTSPDPAVAAHCVRGPAERVIQVDAARIMELMDAQGLLMLGIDMGLRQQLVLGRMHGMPNPLRPTLHSTAALLLPGLPPVSVLKQNKQRVRRARK